MYVKLSLVHIKIAFGNYKYFLFCSLLQQFDIRKLYRPYLRVFRLKNVPFKVVRHET